MPELQNLEVNGIIRSMDGPGSEKCLKSYNIWIRAGELEIGTEEECYESKFDIILLGKYDE